MKKIIYKDNYLLHSGLMFCYYRGVPESMCEDGREAYYYLELFLSKELEPLLDENFQVEIEGYGIFSFQHKDWRTNELKRIWRIEDMKQL